MENKLKEIINQLKEFNIDGETAEDILEELGLRERVLHQILDSEKYIVAEKVWNDFYNNETLIYNREDFSKYYNDKFINDK